MEIIKNIGKKLLKIIRNKYVIGIVVFLVWIIFFDKNNLMDRAQDIKHLRQLEKDKTYYLEQIEKDSKRLEQLRTNNKNLEKFAREQYYMKKDDEDIFVVSEEEKTD